MLFLLFYKLALLFKIFYIFSYSLKYFLTLIWYKTFILTRKNICSR